MTSPDGRATPPRSLVVPERVRVARDLRGLTQEQTVTRAGGRFTAAALSQIETGKTRPTNETASALAEALDVPIDFFFSQRPSVGREKLPYFRHLKSTPAGQRRKASALVLVLSDLVAAIEERVRLPSLDLDIGKPQRGDRWGPAAAAAALRERWGLGDEPIPHVIREMERHGIVVARLALGTDRVDAFSAHGYARPLVLLGTDKQSYVRSRFDAAHELGHLILHEKHQGGDPGIEKEAHEFASALLLPDSRATELLPRAIDARTWQSLAELKRVWGMSIAALLLRAREVGLPDRDYENAMKFMSSRGWRKTEPGDREMGAPESPLLLEEALRVINANDRLTLDDFLREAGLPDDVARELVAAAQDERPTVRI